MNIFLNKLLIIAIFLPFIGFLINGLFGKKIKNEKFIGVLGSSTVGISFLAILTMFFKTKHLDNPIIIKLWDWLSTGSLEIGMSYQIDNLSMVFGMIITGVGLLIHIYSIGYMHGDRSYYRFFSYLNLFIFMMLNLVLSSNLMLTFLGWEGVGLSSYLLIGFWYDRKFEGVGIKSTSDAANKAFIVNRIGDFGFLTAIFFIFYTFNSFEYTTISQAVYSNSSNLQGSSIILIITLLMFLAATGKSAQLPLAVWLPDAMAGPTSVSALIHAATMVTAGVYLIARNSIMFALSPLTGDVILWFGIITALFGATTALVQTDIKKVLAYSTVSQLGFMFAALGVGAYNAAVFHVITHAFFKGLLFLGSGSVIHSMHEEQNILKMGNLKKYMPITSRTFLIGTIAISGLPFLSGFFSKDEIMWYVYSHGTPVAWFLLLVAAFCTAFYMFRLYYLTFEGKERFSHHHKHPHESPATITTPLIILAILSIFGGLLGIPYSLGSFYSKHPNILENTLHHIFEKSNYLLGRFSHDIHMIEYLLMLIATVVAITAILLARKMFKNYEEIEQTKHSVIFKVLWNKYYLDEIYLYLIINPLLKFSDSFIYRFVDKKIIDGSMQLSAFIINRLSSALKYTQTGMIQNYAAVMVISLIIILSILIF